MTYFDPDYLAFFAELEKNNHKDWFDANRKRYESTVKVPFKAFVNDMAEAMAPDYPGMDLSANIQVMRINRDIRFSKDKTPYKIHMGAMIMPHGKKDKSRPGLYVQANHNDVRVYSGAHMLDKEQLYSVREHITDNLDEFNSLVNETDFKSTFGEILGDKNKRLPEEFREAAEKQPLIANKAFYWFFKLSPDLITKDNLIPELISRYRYSLPVNRFFNEALN